ncbi:MAG TPA: hypothetical protein VE135_05735 [Pyrinomonadaceae bacterium]|nr:hypothetical protein [Pyrinomonadaceae bacterium]
MKIRSRGFTLDRLRYAPSRWRLSYLFAFLLISGGALAVFGQAKTAPTPKPPSAEKIVERYLKALGGKKRAAAVTDATYDWIIQLKEQTMGAARTQIKAPGSFRSEMTFANGQIISATSSSSAWTTGLDGQTRTLTGPDALAAKLQGLLEASHFIDYKKAAVLVRVTSVEGDVSDRVFVVEFSTRHGAHLKYSFNARTNLLVKITDETRHTVTRLDDYRAEQGSLEPHRLNVNIGGTGELVFLLQRVTYNSGLSTAVFDAPRAAEGLDVPGLLRAVARNQDEIEKRVTEYAFTQKETDREINGKGEVKKETVKVYEIFPVANREPIQKLISENGVSLSAERAAKEEKRVQEEFLRAERDREKDAQKEERRRAERAKKQRNSTGGEEGEDDPEISQFLLVCEFVSPRREKFANRDAIVFDFRPQAGFHPRNRQEALIAKLVGAVWIDPLDKQVIRLEARLAEGFKMAGGLLLSLRPGAAFVIEQTRMAEGVWLPRFAQINLSVKVLLFGGGDFNKTIEWSDYRHFQGDVSDYKLDVPKSQEKKPE